MQSKSHNRHGAKGMPKTTNPKHPQLSALHHLPLDTPKGPVPFAEAGPASYCCMTLRTLNYGNYGIFLIMGNAGFCPSAVSHFKISPAVFTEHRDHSITKTYAVNSKFQSEYGLASSVLRFFCLLLRAWG